MSSPVRIIHRGMGWHTLPWFYKATLRFDGRIPYDVPYHNGCEVPRGSCA
jgi:hypothetical protein